VSCVWGGFIRRYCRACGSGLIGEAWRGPIVGGGGGLPSVIRDREWTRMGVGGCGPRMDTNGRGWGWEVADREWTLMNANGGGRLRTANGRQWGGRVCVDGSPAPDWCIGNKEDLKPGGLWGGGSGLLEREVGRNLRGTIEYGQVEHQASVVGG
jgi:hypothetical protein